MRKRASRFMWIQPIKNFVPGLKKQRSGVKQRWERISSMPGSIGYPFRPMKTLCMRLCVLRPRGSSAGDNWQFNDVIYLAYHVMVVDIHHGRDWLVYLITGPPTAGGSQF